ncbi:MAG: helix-turn-helix transcriptional regulator, partial [Caldilinea sp.]
MPTFGELLNQYIERAGITDAELARSTGLQRQTIFRWKEGVTARPRYREDVIRIAARLRLSPSECDTLLLAAGFPPNSPTAGSLIHTSSTLENADLEDTDLDQDG